MAALRSPLSDSTLSLLVGGYGLLPDLWRQSTEPVLRLRLFGRAAVALCGPDAVRFFYDERHIARHGTLPGPVLATLFGRGAVHTLDGDAHRARKALFLSLLKDPGGIDALAAATGTAWDEAVAEWTDGRTVTLFDDTSRLLTRSVCQWAGIPLRPSAVRPVARDLVAMVDGFAAAGPRHVRARRARARAEASLTRLVEQVRAAPDRVPDGSAVRAVAQFTDESGELMSPRVAAVELLNIVRPTVAVSWFVAFAAHALHRAPEQRGHLLKEGPEYAEAFAHEVRRFYPFAPFAAGTAARDLTWRGTPIGRGTLVLLDLYGQNHDPDLWRDPYTFDPGRFLEHPPERDTLVPQGGGDPEANHRCPGEDITVRLLTLLSSRLAHLEYDVPAQDLRIPLGRVPTGPRSGFLLNNVRRSAT